MPKVVDHEAYRCELLRDSFEVVAQVGYGSLSLKLLARSLNISTGLIYHYFENKEDWFVSLVAFQGKAVIEMLSGELPVDASLSRKIELLAAHIEHNKEHYANLISVVSDFVRIPSVSQEDGMLHLRIAVNHLYEHIATLFATDERTVRALLSYLIGAIMANRLDPRSLDADECLPVIRMLLMKKGERHC